MASAVPEVESRGEGSLHGASSRRALLGAATAVAAFGSVPLIGRLFRVGDAFGSRSPAQDAKILQLVQLLEYTQVAFYAQALNRAGLKGELREFAHTALGHERQHLAAIEKALGSRALARPAFAFGAKTRNPGAFARAAIDLEDIAVAAYNGQAPNLTKRTLAAAAEIVSVEARHAAWVRAIVGRIAAPDPVDRPMTAREAAAGLHGIGLRA
jgi:rubrerythrin